MLTLVDSKTEKMKAFKQLKARLTKTWHTRESRRVVWRPNSRQMNVHHNGEYWFGSVSPSPGDATARLWNPFGAYRKNGSLRITVEINISTSRRNNRLSGFFAGDPRTGTVYLMHDGGVGGGRKGVGRKRFLAWSNAKLVAVADAKGHVRLGIVVAAVDARTTANDVARFVSQVLDYKQAVADGETDTPEAREKERTYTDYFDEFTGKKRRRQMEEIEYISRHGDIVRALRDWRNRPPHEEGRIVKNAYIDLAIEMNGVLTELYEVKTNCDRHTLYSALGQMLVYDDSDGGTCQRFVVLPTGQEVPGDVIRAFGRANIALLRFECRGSGVRILNKGH